MNSIAERAAGLIAVLRGRNPLIHHMTNHVVMSDCAEATLYSGGSPVMTLSRGEAADMAFLADALVINIGTLTTSFCDAAVIAGKAANRKGIPVLLDPVGAGATPMRTRAARSILGEVDVDIVKGNLAEMSVLSGLDAEVRGVDSAGSSAGPAEVCSKFHLEHGSVAVVTGEFDYVCGGKNVFRIGNGHVMLSKVVGTGCMLGSVTACFAAVAETPESAACAGAVFFGVAAGLAAEKADGPAAFKRALLDELASLDSEKIKKFADVSTL